MNNNSKKILSYILVLASLFIIVLFTKNLIFDLQANLDLKDSKTKQEQDKRQEFQELRSIKQKLEQTSDTEVSKYSQAPTEDEIIDYIYSMIENGNTGKEIEAFGKKIPLAYGSAEIQSISISEAKKNELGFLESDISLNLSVQKEVRMKNILDFFVTENSKYKFFIDNFSYQKPTITGIASDTNPSYMNITIPLKVFYK